MEAYVHGVSTRKVDDLVKALGVDSGISKSEVSRICAELDAEVAGVPVPLAGPHRLPVRVPGRHLPQGPRGRTGRVPSGRDRHRGDHRRRPRGPRPGRWRQRGRRLLDRVPALAQGPRARPGSSWSSPTPTPASSQAIAATMAGAAGSAAGSTSCATCWPGCPGARPRWSPRPSAPSSPSPPAPRSSSSSTRSPAMLAAQVPQAVATMLATPRGPARLHRLPACALDQDLVAPTRWSGSTRRSSAAPTWSGSSPMTPPCCGWPGRC